MHVVVQWLELCVHDRRQKHGAVNELCHKVQCGGSKSLFNVK